MPITSNRVSVIVFSSLSQLCWFERQYSQLDQRFQSARSPEHGALPGFLSLIVPAATPAKLSPNSGVVCVKPDLLRAFALAFAQLADPSFRRIVWLSVGISIGVLLFLWIGVGILLTQTPLFRIGWLDAGVDILGGLATLALTWLMFPAAVSAIMGLFLDRAVARVEQRHYPRLQPARTQSFEEIVVSSLKFFGTLVLCNLASLIFLAIPVVFPFVFYAVNGYLLGREYFELAAFRRMDPEQATGLRKRYQKRVFAAGVIIALLLTVPLLNVLAPIVGAAAMVHIVQGLTAPSLGAAERVSAAEEESLPDVQN
jgi:uncharacterized protein involved in cysteine biosynthesis